MDSSEILVSIFCQAYNHEKYIKDALDGFVNQKTNFRFEVLVHDDASTDGTQLIIKEYADQYPDIIKPILQTENQYSKGVSISETILFPKANGKYIAFCEGDDYWTNENKLQIQVDFLEQYNEYSACVHNTKIVDIRNNKEIKIYPDVEMDIKVKRLLFEGGICFHLSSLVFRREFFFYPEEFHIKGVGDYPRGIFLALCGKIYYFPQIMSVYRYGTENSWTVKNDFDNYPERMRAHYQNIKTMLINVDEYSNYQYHKTINEIIKKNEINCLLAEGKHKTVLTRFDLSFWFIRANGIKKFTHLFISAFFKDS